MEKLMTDAKNVIYTLWEHFCLTELTDKMNQSHERNALKELELELNKKKWQENHLKIKNIEQFKKLMNLETEIAEKLKLAEDKPVPEMSVEIETMKTEINQLRSPLTLKNFNYINKSKKSEILQDLKDISNNMEHIELLRSSINIENYAYLYQIANKLNELDGVVQRCDLEKEELNSYVLRYISSKIGLKQGKKL